MTVVYLGLGSNLGNRKSNIKKALTYLRANKIQIKKLSSIIETDPVGGPKQGKFLNAAAKVSTQLTPQKLLTTLKSIEKKLGRVKTIKYGPRTIDIDILIYDRRNMNTPDLKIPHPRMIKRDFVMRPLREIAPRLARELTCA